MRLTIMMALSGLLFVGGSGDPVDYFPEGVFYEDLEWDFGTQETVREYLMAIDELPLFRRESAPETYRLIWLPNFDPGIMVRVTNSGDPKARVAEYSGLSPEEGAVIRTVDLPPEDWKSLKASIAESGFWEAMENSPVPQGQVVLDGSRWVLEGVWDGRYKAVQRIFPRRDREEDAAFLDLSLTILNVAGVKMEEDEVY